MCTYFSKTNFKISWEFEQRLSAPLICFRRRQLPTLPIRESGPGQNVVFLPTGHKDSVIITCVWKRSGQEPWLAKSNTDHHLNSLHLNNKCRYNSDCNQSVTLTWHNINCSIAYLFLKPRINKLVRTALTNSSFYLWNAFNHVSNALATTNHISIQHLHLGSLTQIFKQILLSILKTTI